MDCNIDDDLFELIIEQDVQSDKCEKENANENVDYAENFLINRKPSQQQYDMMQKFIDAYGDYTEIGREGSEELWEQLKLKLNSIGPPEYAALEWRRKWTVYKQNLKRKLKSISEKNDHRQGANTKFGESLWNNVGHSTGKLSSSIRKSEESSKKRKVAVLSQAVCESSGTRMEIQDPSFRSEVLKRLDKVVENQKIMIGQQKSILDKLG